MPDDKTTHVFQHEGDRLRPMQVFEDSLDHGSPVVVLTMVAAGVRKRLARETCHKQVHVRGILGEEVREAVINDAAAIEVRCKMLTEVWVQLQLSTTSGRTSKPNSKQIKACT